MSHDFVIVWSHRDLLLSGLTNTVWLSVVTELCALLLGTFLATAFFHRSRAVVAVCKGSVDAMRCIPFLLFAYIVYYGLPSMGVRLDSWSSGLVALIVYHTAYMAEILAAAWRALPREPIEAGRAFGFSGMNLVLRVILPPLTLSSAPVFGNQLIQIVKDTAFLTVIALPELTHAATAIQSNYYVPFASFVTAMLLYWALCLIVEACVSRVGRMAEARR